MDQVRVLVGHDGRLSVAASVGVSTGKMEMGCWFWVVGAVGEGERAQRAICPSVLAVRRLFPGPKRRHWVRQDVRYDPSAMSDHVLSVYRHWTSVELEYAMVIMNASFPFSELETICASKFMTRRSEVP